MSDLREIAARAAYSHVSGGEDPEEAGLEWMNYGIDGDEAYGEPQGKDAYLSLADAIIAAIEPALRKRHRAEFLQELIAEAKQRYGRGGKNNMLWDMSMNMYIDWLSESARQEAETDDR